jgi:hypothetical protein
VTCVSKRALRYSMVQFSVFVNTSDPGSSWRADGCVVG